MNTSSYRAIASGTYNRWKVEYVLYTIIRHFSLDDITGILFSFDRRTTFKLE